MSVDWSCDSCDVSGNAQTGDEAVCALARHYQAVHDGRPDPLRDAMLKERLAELGIGRPEPRRFCGGAKR